MPAPKPAVLPPKPTNPPVFVGVDRVDEARAPIHLKPASMLRHMMALGSSGSGKTVVCKIVVEELVRSGLPAICIDPQGDLCSLALNADPEFLASKGIDPALAAEFAAKADVVVFTPAARKGVALSADPISDVTGLPKSERVYAITGVASMVVSLLGYDLDSDDGSGLVAVFDRALSRLADAGRYPANLDQFTRYMLKLDDASKEELSKYLDVKKIDHACQKLARLDVGARRLLFHEGLALDIDLLLGRGGARSAAQDDKARVSVIYLNTLNSQEDKEFFVAALVERLYAWMLKNPSEEPQALFYIDEVAPFIPPVRKPACKPALSLLFKQARKYGICCLMATQNPADVDYKAMAQFGTWAIGRLTTRQDMAKVQPTVKSLDPVNVDKIMEELPAQKPGQFILISPDNFKNTHRLQTRWLLTEHRTLNDEDIEQLAIERWHDRFATLEAEQSDLNAARTGEGEIDADAGSAKRQRAALATQPDEGDDEVEEDVEEESEAEAEPATAPSEELVNFDNRLARKPSVSAAEFAMLVKMSDGQARSVLRKLCNVGLARQYKEGRVQRYWSISNGLRPDLGLDEPVSVFTARITMQEAERLGRELRASKTLGIFGDDEELDHIEMEYRLVLQVGFSEKVTRSFWKKISSFDFKPLDELADHVYLHPTNLKFVTYTPDGGIKLEDAPGEYASRVRDFDGVTTVEKTPPAALKFNAAELAQRKVDDIVKQTFKQRFNASPKYVRHMFLPAYQLHMVSRGRSGTRIAMIDGLSGKPLVW